LPVGSKGGGPAISRAGNRSREKNATAAEFACIGLLWVSIGEKEEKGERKIKAQEPLRFGS